MKKLNIAIIGQGRSGRQIHGEFYLSEKNTKFNVAYVVDQHEVRRAKAKEAFPNATILSSYTELFDKKDIDLVVNASYSKDHYPISKDLLEHGFNVLCEKPFCKSEAECRDLIETAKKNNVLIAAFQQSFYAPYCEHAFKLAKDGTLGDILEVSLRFSGFSRRWDWQTLQKMVGGNAYNTGPHPIGLGVGFLDFSKDLKIVYSNLQHTEMSAGDYDDFVKIILTAPGKPVVDIEINNTDAYSPYNVKIIGSRGCYKTNIFSYEMKYIVPGENVPREPVQDTLVNENGDPCYCGEKLVVHEVKGEYEGTAFDVGTQKLYDDIYEAIVNGKEMYITAEKALLTTKVISEAHDANPIEKRF